MIDDGVLRPTLHRRTYIQRSTIHLQNNILLNLTSSKIYVDRVTRYFWQHDLTLLYY